MSVILRVDAHCIIRDKILGFESHNVLAGSLISPVDLLLGVLPPHVDEDLQIRIAEEVDTWESLDDNEKDEFLREYCKSGRDYLDRWHELLNHKVTPTKDQHPYCGPLEDLTKEELISAAKAFGITLPSNKNYLSEISELVSTGREQFASKGCDLLVALIDGAWGFRPLSGSEAMRNGSIAEPHAREKLPGFIRAVGQALHSIGSSHDFAFCSEVFELGLLEADGYPYVVTSVDGSLFVSSEANPENPDVLIQMVWENKTLFSETTIDEAKRLESDYGCYSLVEFKNDDSMGELQRKLANFGARKLELMQIVHHAAVTGSDVIYTLMDGFTGEFIRMVRISFDEEWRQLHLSTIQKIFCHHVPSTFNDSVTMKIGENKAGVTWNELSNMLKMREAIRAGSLDEAAGRFLPTVARIWNRTKSAVDAQSKEVISLRVNVGGDLRRKLICESLLFLLVGSVLLLRAHTIHDDVDRLQGRDHILRAMTLVGSTRDLVQRAIDEIEVREPKQIIVAPILTGGVAQFFRTPAPSSANYNPSDVAWEIRAKTEVENVASTSALKAEAFNEGILKEVRLHETPGSWHIHTAVQGNRGEREHCVVCCSKCDQFWGMVTSAEIKGSTKEELADRLKAYHDRSTRRGYKSIVKCGCCRVTLCQKSRPALFGTEVSCWEVWHSVSNLVTTHPMFPPQHLTLSKRGNVTSAALVANETVKPTDSAKKRRKAASSTKNYHGSGVRRDNDDQDD